MLRRKISEVLVEQIHASKSGGHESILRKSSWQNCGTPSVSLEF